MLSTRATVNEIAAEYPVSTRIFQRHKINFCCGGSVPLEEACANKGIDVQTVVTEIEREVELASPEELETWLNRPTGELIEHILTKYHRPLDDALPHLEFLATKVARVHGELDPTLLDLAYNVVQLKEELESHFIKEEQVLFPAILAGEAEKLACPIAVMLRDHEDAERHLEAIRELTHDYQKPPHACGSWRALWDGLYELERSLQEHIHLENTVLFPRVGASA